MKTILVPTDFSENAKNAAKYALAIAEDLQAQKIIFYNAYQSPPVMTENALPAIPVIDIETLKDVSEEGMKVFINNIREYGKGEIEIEHKTGYSILANDINDLCEEVRAELIVMGITGTSKIEEVLIGSTALSVVKQTKVPVIVVPADATYTSIKNVMFACDFKKVVETTPVQPIKNVLDATKALLHIVNVYESDKEITPEKTRQQELLHSLLKDYNPEFHFENNEHFIEGINHFVETHAIDIIITIPRKHKLFEGLFKERHTKKLAFHSHVPLMFIHQEDL
ncbi:universal stress protein [Segetibacter aerophilus]|uniref:Universal stress protein UspA n=1 Tax=Segetibacter aerophilus TaxID=670293 RepID=A0A512BFE3_9BACT|nr:universal stress protein [Segetibacter aerophilus]GEO10681.1 universal stress protein UspA [Segetibacter aerophilus]